MRDETQQLNTAQEPGTRACFGADTIWRVAASRVSATGASLHGAVSERILIWSVALYSAVMLMLANAETAAAQSGGGSDPVGGAIQSAVVWLSNLITILGTLGLMIAAVFWLFSGSDERKRQRATGWLVSCALAIGIAFMAPELVNLIGNWAGQGGGGAG